jgi:hypothetical protein
MITLLNKLGVHYSCVGNHDFGTQECLVVSDGAAVQCAHACSVSNVLVVTQTLASITWHIY